MPFTMTMPKLSPTMETGTIAKWHKNEGEFVEPGDLLLEVSTDKATVEHNALDEGWLKKVLLKEGDEAWVNQAIAIFTEEKDESIDGYQPEGDEPPKEEVEAPVEEGDQEVSDQQKTVSAKAGVGMQQPDFAPAPPLDASHIKHVARGPGERVLASPLAKKLAKEKGLDLSSIQGTGPRGRIMSRDLEKAQPAGEVRFTPGEIPSIPPGSYTEEPISHIRKIIGQRLQESKTFIPHFYVSTTVDAAPMFETRQQLIESGVKVSFNDMVVKGTALALRKFPDVNCGFYAGKEAIIRFETIDISIAVSMDSGLITPIVRYADYKNLGEISSEIRSLAKRAKEGKLAPEEFQGGSFTISNLGMFGIDEFIAVINPPQAAILAIGGIHDVPVVKDGKIVAGKQMKITLSADHRVVDGALGAQFLQGVKKYLENPATLLL